MGLESYLKIANLTEAELFLWKIKIEKLIIIIVLASNNIWQYQGIIPGRGHSSLVQENDIINLANTKCTN